MKSGNNMTGIIWFMFFAVLYFSPSIVAYQKKKVNLNSIFVVNFFLGWTLIGWVITLAWALAVDKK